MSGAFGFSHGPAVPKYDPNKTPTDRAGGIDDDFEGSVLDGKWKPVNHTTGTYATVKGSWVGVYDPPRNTRIVGYETPISGNSWEVQARWALEAPTIQYNGIGLFLKEAVSGRYYIFTLIHHPSYGYLAPLIIRCTDAATYYNEADGNLWWLGLTGYLSIALSGSTLSFRTSASGVHFIEIFSLGLSDWFGGAAPTHIGFGMHRYSTWASIIASFDWIRRVA